MKYILILFLVNFCVAKNIEFLDEEGNLISLEHPASRVIMFPIPLASFSIAVDGTTNRLANINPIAKDAIKDGILGKIFPSALDIPTSAIGANFVPNTEEILRLKPDLVLQWGHMPQKIIEPLKKLGVSLALINYGNENNALFWFNMIGKAYNQEDRVSEIIKHRNNIREKIENIAAKIAYRPKIMYIQHYKSNIIISGKDTYNDWSMKLVGANNVAKFSGTKTVNIEQIIQYDPDVILLNNFEKSLSPQDIYKNKFLKNLKAVKNKTVYKMPLGGVRWDPPGQESPLSWIWMYKISYNNSSLNLKEEMKNVFKMLYNYELNEEEMRQILHYDLNKFSKNYENILD